MPRAHPRRQPLRWANVSDWAQGKPIDVCVVAQRGQRWLTSVTVIHNKDGPAVDAKRTAPRGSAWCRRKLHPGGKVCTVL